jgi:hypothetical protein
VRGLTQRSIADMALARSRRSHLLWCETLTAPSPAPAAGRHTSSSRSNRAQSPASPPLPPPPSPHPRFAVAPPPLAATHTGSRGRPRDRDLGTRTSCALKWLGWQVAGDLFEMSFGVADAYLNPVVLDRMRPSSVRLGLLEYRRAAPDRADPLLKPGNDTERSLRGNATASFGGLRCLGAAFSRVPCAFAVAPRLPLYLWFHLVGPTLTLPSPAAWSARREVGGSLACRSTAERGDRRPPARVSPSRGWLWVCGDPRGLVDAMRVRQHRACGLLLHHGQDAVDRRGQ